MKKICLTIVLCIVSVFSISAQTGDKPAENPGAAENVKVETIELKPVTDAITTTGKPSETESSAESKKPGMTAAAEQKAAIDEAAKKPEVNTSVKPSEVAESQKKPAPAEQKLPPAETVNRTASNESEKNSGLGETAKKPEAPILEVKKYSLGELSTGNAAVDDYIEQFSELYDIDPLLIYAQMSQESSFRARATSSKGASGFMQLMPATARRFGVTNIYNPKQNIKAGVKYMRWLLDKFAGDTRLALAGYNAGEGAVMKYGNKIPPYRETQNYVAKIMDHYELITNRNSTLAQNGQQSESSGSNP